LAPTLEIRATVTSPYAQRFLDFTLGDSLVLPDQLYIRTLNDHGGFLLTSSRRRGNGAMGGDGRNLTGISAPLRNSLLKVWMANAD
jgi:hypothetical protein